MKKAQCKIKATVRTLVPIFLFTIHAASPTVIVAITPTKSILRLEFLFSGDYRDFFREISRWTNLLVQESM